MTDVLRHPLVLVLVAAVFSAGFVPWATRRWQNRQRELEIQTTLVAEMSECVMRFVAELEYSHPLAQVGEAPIAADDNDGGGARSKDAMRQFDVQRCVIGTKLEVYYPVSANGVTISPEWSKFADSLIHLYELSDREGEDYAKFAAELPTRLGKCQTEKDRAKATAEERKDVVDAGWGELEQLLLAEKVRLIAAVLQTRISPLAVPLLPRGGLLRPAPLLLLALVALLIASVIAAAYPDLVRADAPAGLTDALKLTGFTALAVALISLLAAIISEVVRFLHRGPADAGQADDQ